MDQFDRSLAVIYMNVSRRCSGGGGGGGGGQLDASLRVFFGLRSGGCGGGGLQDFWGRQDAGQSAWLYLHV